MPSNESSPKWTMPVFNPADFTRMGQDQANALMEVQRELAKFLEKANADWMARVEVERELASELTSKLSAAKGLPDAAKAYQDWMARRVETMTKDSQKFFADSQKFVTSMNRFMSGGGQGSSS